MVVSDIDLGELRAALDSWARLVAAERGAEGVYLFGSLVYRGGAQFTSLSDVDLVVKFGTSMNALARATWLGQLFPLKKQLEITLLSLLQRRIVEPLASVAAVTQAEIDLDIQKENQPSFYSSNTFVDLLSGATIDGLPGSASAAPCNRLLAGSISMTQKMRHQFLGVSANNRTILQPFDGEDRVPKAVMRAAAMARRLADPSLGKGAEYDTRLGLDHLTKYLLDHEKDDLRLEDLSRLISERRGARGEGGPISQFDQLLLSEIVFDLAAASRQGSSIMPVSLPRHGTPPSQQETHVVPDAPNDGGSAPANTTQKEGKPPLPKFKGGTPLSFFGPVPTGVSRCSKHRMVRPKR